MAIHKSRAFETTRLLADVLTGTPVEVEAATARLIVLGARSLPHLRTALAGALERSDDATSARLLDVVTQVSPAAAIEIVSAAAAPVVGPQHEASVVEAWRAALAGGERTLSTRALDHLTALTLDATAPRSIRIRALAALREAAPDVVAPIEARVAAALDPPPPAVLAASAAALDEMPVESDADLDALRARVHAEADAAPLSLLHKLITRLRTAESARHGDTRQQVAHVRATVHVALAHRGSTVALYDLRDSFERDPAPLPVGMFAAMAAVGDADSLDALCAAWMRMDDGWSRGQITEAGQAILGRHALGPRHAAVKRARARCAALIDAISTPSRSTPSKSRAPRT